MSQPEPPHGRPWADVRDVVLVAAGVMLTIFEALTHEHPRTELLVLYASMMGLPAYLISRRGGSS